MLNSHVEFSPGTHASTNPGSLALAVEGLLHLLNSYSQEGATNQAAGDGRLISWEDEEYSYIETEIDAPMASQCDISVSRGKVFIRIAKEEEHEELDERLPRLAELDLRESEND